MWINICIADSKKIYNEAVLSNTYLNLNNFYHIHLKIKIYMHICSLEFLFKAVIEIYFHSTKFLIFYRLKIFFALRALLAFRVNMSNKYSPMLLSFLFVCLFVLWLKKSTLNLQMCCLLVNGSAALKFFLFSGVRLRMYFNTRKLIFFYSMDKRWICGN